MSESEGTESRLHFTAPVPSPSREEFTDLTVKLRGGGRLPPFFTVPAETVLVEFNHNIVFSASGYDWRYHNGGLSVIGRSGTVTRPAT